MNHSWVSKLPAVSEGSLLGVLEAKVAQVAETCLRRSLGKLSDSDELRCFCSLIDSSCLPLLADSGPRLAFVHPLPLPPFAAE